MKLIYNGQKRIRNRYWRHVSASLVSVVLLFGGRALAQSEDNYGSYDDYNSTNGPDSSNHSYNESSEGSSYSNYFGSSSKKSSAEPTKKIVKKPYVRFIPPYDSTRELIIYQAIIEVVDNEGYEVEIDTIYGRAQKWIESQYGKDMKKVISSNDVNANASEMEYKIRVHADFPCMIQPNEFTETRSGTVTYEMEIRVRDGRYRYAIKNLVHVADPRPGEKEGDKNYFEYLMKTQDDVRGSDQVLIAADRKINSMISELKKACETAPLEEDDDW